MGNKSPVKRRRRVVFIISLLLGIGTAAGLTLYALRQNINLYLTPTQVFVKKPPTTQTFRLGGMVLPGSVHHAREGLKVTFVLTDYKHTTRVVFDGLLPSLFREGQGIVAQGHLNSRGDFIAEEVLAKHDNEYKPPIKVKSIP